MTENKGAGSIVSHLELPVDSYRPSFIQTQTILLSMGNKTSVWFYEMLPSVP